MVNSYFKREKKTSPLKIENCFSSKKMMNNIENELKSNQIKSKLKFEIITPYEVNLFMGEVIECGLLNKL